MAREREEVDQRYKWDLDTVYGNEEEWEEDFEEAKQLVEKIQDYEGELNDPGTLLEALEHYENLMRKVGKLSRYASMKSDEDARVQQYQALSSRAQSLSSEASAASSFMQPEIQQLGEERIQEMMREREELEKYSHYFDNMLRMKPHTRSQEVEDVLSQLGDVLDASSDVYSIFSNADLTFPEVEKPEGETVEITQSNFTKLLKNRDRDFRKKVHEKFYDRIDEYRNTIGETFENAVRTDVRMAGVRNFDTAREAALYPNSIPTEVYDNLVDTVEDNLDVLHRHAELKKKALDVDELKPWDLYMPLEESESPEIEYEEAKEHVIEAIGFLGDRYQNDAKEGLESGWVDVYENKGKRSGAYSGGSYDTKPFILMNFQEDIQSMYTLAHELGHSMHSYYTNRNQPYIYSNYKIFVAEVASTVNEALLTHHLLETVEDEEFRRHVLSHYLENFRNTLFRQTMFADFEQKMHEKVENGEALTPDVMDESYGELKEKFYEPAVTDEKIRKEWMRIPHFYYGFYVFQYSTGISAAVTLAEKIMEGDEKAREAYLKFLKSGGSKYPLQLLRDAGVNLESTEPIEKAIDVYDEHLKKMEELV